MVEWSMVGADEQGHLIFSVTPVLCRHCGVTSWPLVGCGMRFRICGWNAYQVNRYEALASDTVSMSTHQGDEQHKKRKKVKQKVLLEQVNYLRSPVCHDSVSRDRLPQVELLLLVVTSCLLSAVGQEMHLKHSPHTWHRAIFQLA
jgi:hypothetical protein